MADEQFVYGRANGNPRKARRLYAESHFTNYSPNFNSESESRPFAPSINALCNVILVQSNAKLAHISARIDFWTYVDWEFFAH
jgi:hypothetical protein